MLKKENEDDGSVLDHTSITAASSTSNSSLVSSSEHSRDYEDENISNRNINDDESLCEELGIMFEGSYPTTTKHFTWPSTDHKDEETQKDDNSESTNTMKPIHISLSCIDEEPGAVQSGHYLWPAAPALCDYMVATFSENLRTSAAGANYCDDSTSSFRTNIKTILELGSGTGLLSLTALQLYQNTLECLVVTDHDCGTLERSRDNYETTMLELYEHAISEEEKEKVINNIASIPIEFISLKWGNTNEWKNLQKTVRKDHKFWKNHLPVSFELILGSDLIYCISVVQPLLLTAKNAMQANRKDSLDGRFILSQSFMNDEKTEEEIDRVCRKLHLKRNVLKDDLSEGGSKIQEFRHLKR